MMQKTLILGIGSPFCDDQFGWEVIKYLEINHQNELDKIDNITTEYVDRPGLNLLLFLQQGYEKIVLVDLVQAYQKVGTHFFFKAQQIISFEGFLSSHSIGVSPSLALANALGGNIDNVSFYGVQGKNFDAKDDLVSKEVMAEVEPMAKEILQSLTV